MSASNLKTHSPYTFKVLADEHMHPETRVEYYGCSSSSASSDNGDYQTYDYQYQYRLPDAEIAPAAQHFMPSYQHPPCPPSYAQSTLAKARMTCPSPTDSDSESFLQSQEPSNVVPDGVYHRQLIGKCQFISPPNLSPRDEPTPTYPCYRLFLGQIRFETTTTELQWIIRFVSGVRALKIEPRNSGCFLAYFKNYEDLAHVKALNKRILFDHHGIWFAAQPSQAEYLQHYVSSNLTNIGRGFRLPKDMMVVEEEKLRQNPHLPAYSPFPMPY